MLSLTVFWINALVRSYSLYRILATIFFFFFFVPGFNEHYHVFIHIFFFKYLNYFIQSL